MGNVFSDNIGRAFSLVNTPITESPNIKISDINTPGLEMPHVHDSKAACCTTNDFKELKGAFERMHAEMIGNFDTLKMQRDHEAAKTGTVREENEHSETLDELKEKSNEAALRSQLQTKKLRACLDEERKINEGLRDRNAALQKKLGVAALDTEEWKMESKYLRARINAQESAT